MIREEFSKYAVGIRNIINESEDWKGAFPTLLERFLPRDGAAAYRQILNALGVAAYDAVNSSKGNSPVIDELAALLRSVAEQKDYKYAAYYFAAAVFAVAMEKLPLSEVELEVIDSDELFEFDTSALIPEDADPITSKLLYYKNRLLDFSRNNQLVHFRQTKNKTLPLRAPSLSSLLAAVSSGKRIPIARWTEITPTPEKILRCKQCKKYSFEPLASGTLRHSAKCPTCDTGSKKSMTPLPFSLTLTDDRGIRCQKCTSFNPLDRLHTSEPLCQQCLELLDIPAFPIMTATKAISIFGDTSVICSLDDADTNKTADNLIKKAESLRKNFGLQPLYLACGFLDWRDASGTEYHSPILLCRVQLQYDSGLGKYFIIPEGMGDSAFAVNKTLSHMLSAYTKHISIPLPAYDGSGKGYLEALKTLWNSTPNRAVAGVTADWRISDELAIGLFHYQKLQLEQDLDANKDKYLAHPIIRRICGDTDTVIDSAPQISDSLQHVILDADSSQETVIRSAQEGRSFILQGPPGSGKSQTISNIIAVALGEGKTVLFVTEKATARSIIVDNLARLRIDGTRSLANFVLDFDRFTTRTGAIGQKSFVTALNSSLDPAITVMGFGKVLEDERFYRKEIGTYIEQLTKPYSGVSYQNFIQDIAPYLEYAPLHSLEDLPEAVDISLPVLVSKTGEYYDMVSRGIAELDYKTDPLHTCKGADTYADIETAEQYLELEQRRQDIYAELADILELTLNTEGDITIEQLKSALSVWTSMPSAPLSLIGRLSTAADADKLLSHAKKRREFLSLINASTARAFCANISEEALSAFRPGDLESIAAKYRSVFSRLGRGFKETMRSVFRYKTDAPISPSYDDFIAFIEQLNSFRIYHSQLNEYRTGNTEDRESFGITVETVEEWDRIISELEQIKSVFDSNPANVIPLSSNRAFLLHFTPENRSYTVSVLTDFAEELSEMQPREAALAEKLASLFTMPRRAAGRGASRYNYYANLAAMLTENRDRAVSWYKVCELIEWFRANGVLAILDELIRNGISNRADAEGMITRAYYVRSIRSFVKQYDLDILRDFTPNSHAERISHYADADLALLSGGAIRLYNALSENLNKAGAVYAEKHHSTLPLPKLQTRTGISARQLIKDEWEYIKRIKPCFMMSPLNVSQYLDIDMQFDMVIFDEASQIFTEDSLASIVRGKQIIIAGDSKQLPPCDFFRAGGNYSVDTESELYEADDDTDAKGSLLTDADEMLGDVSVSLSWHYRSYDEALIAFSNENMEYNLVSFPSAIKNTDDGIEHIKIPYSPDTCYSSGKSKSHINPGEADMIVELLWREINHSTRNAFSLGVVAFSTAQAAEIESRWLVFKDDPSRKAVIAEWEERHKDEPIIFCNLDTMQGDERDTMLLSICYSPDAEGKFNLTYLGALRLPAGKKRLNVAITRSRHRMIVVSTMDVSTLQNAILTSSAPDCNKEGSEMLCKFLRYAEEFTHTNKPVTAPPRDAFTAAICRILDCEGIPYNTEIGRSECRISIGICDRADPNSFALGIIIDDPNRTDFDSEREYARLTEQVLCGKYNWSLYRIFPTAWINDYPSELAKLLNRIYEAYGESAPDTEGYSDYPATDY